MTSLALFGVPLLLAAATPAPPASGPTAVIMMMDARGGVPPDTAAQLTTVLTENLKDLGAFGSVATIMDLQSLITLEQQKQLMECTASSCMAEIGGAMGAQFVVVSSVGKLGSSFLLAATLVDTRTAQTVNSVTETVPGPDEGALPQAIPRVVFRLLQKGGLLRAGVSAPTGVAAGNPGSPTSVPTPSAPAPTPPAPVPPPPHTTAPPAPQEAGSSGPRRSTLIGLSAIPAVVLSVLGGLTTPVALLAAGVAGLLVAEGSLNNDTESSSEDVGIFAAVFAAAGLLLLLGLVGGVTFGLVAVVLVVVALVGRGAEKVEELVSQKDDTRAVPVARVSARPR